MLQEIADLATHGELLAGERGGVLGGAGDAGLSHGGGDTARYGGWTGNPRSVPGLLRYPQLFDGNGDGGAVVRGEGQVAKRRRPDRVEPELGEPLRCGAALE